MDNVREITFREYGVTDIHPIALAFTLVMCVVALFVRRERAVLPLLLVACLVPMTQRLVVATLDFNMVRIVLLAGWVRMLARGELRPFRWKALDTAFLAWLASASLIHVLREGSVGALIYRLGIGFDAVGAYFLFRILLQSRSDLERTARSLATVTTLVGAAMAVEWLTARNVFALLGGVPFVTEIRDGALRCRGAFAHPIIAGSFGAAMAPIFIGLALARPAKRWLAWSGFAGATLVAFASGSSGALMAYMTGLAAWGLWRYRGRLRTLQWALLLGTVVIHFGREKPIWHLIGRVSSLTGGTGWHRYRLIDAFVANFDEWWLLGTRNAKYWGWGLQDITNQFVASGVHGGLLTLLVFLVLLWLAFASVGRAMRVALRLRAREQPRSLFFLWGWGASLSVHCVSWLSVTYFGQMQYVFYLSLAMIAALRPPLLRRPAPAPAPRPEAPPPLPSALADAPPSLARALRARPAGGRRR